MSPTMPQSRVDLRCASTWPADLVQGLSMLGVALIVSLVLAAHVHAIPPAVMEPYRAYMAAIEADDLAGAVRHAEEAYQAGVAERVDTETLAALAENRAQLLYDLGRYSAAAPAWDAVYVVAPDLNVLALAASAHLLAGDAQPAAERAQSLLAAGRGLPDDLQYLARYIIAVDAGPDGFTARTGREAFQRGRAPELVQEFMREGQRRLQARQGGLEYRYAAFAAGAAAGIGLHPATVGHLRRWANEVELTEGEARTARAHLEESLFAALLIRQGVFPVRDRDADAADEVPAGEFFAPEYPEAALMRGRQGYTIVRFDVTEAGVPDNVEVVFSVPDDPMFDRASVLAVEQWRYEPRMDGGVPVRRTGIETGARFTLD